MRAAGRLARKVLDTAGRAVGVGVTTDAIDTLVHETIVAVRMYGTACMEEGLFDTLTLRRPHNTERRIPESPQLPRLSQKLLYVCQ